MKNFSRKTQGIIAFTFALLLAAVLIMRIIYVFAFCTRILPAWFVFYRFTYLTNYLMLIWLLLFGFSCFFKKFTKLEKLTTHPTVLIALTLYSSILIIYFIVALPLGQVDFGYLIYYVLPHRVFGYVLTPAVMWFFFLTIKRESVLKRQSKFEAPLIILIFPTVFFMLNMIIGHTVTYGEEIPAFAYAALNPTYLNMLWLFILFIFVAIAMFGLVAYMLLLLNNKITSKQLQKRKD